MHVFKGPIDKCLSPKRRIKLKVRTAYKLLFSSWQLTSKTYCEQQVWKTEGSIMEKKKNKKIHILKDVLKVLNFSITKFS